jgi:hypothetical protein
VIALLRAALRGGQLCTNMDVAQMEELLTQQENRWSLSVERMCRLTQVSRAGFYRPLNEQMPVEEDMEVRSTTQQTVQPGEDSSDDGLGSRRIPAPDVVTPQPLSRRHAPLTGPWRNRPPERGRSCRCRDHP